MPDVICNTSPLQYLWQLDLIHLLNKIYDHIIIPDAVVDELNQGRKIGVEVPVPESFDWIKTRSVIERRLLPVVTGLGKGEKEVLALGLESLDSLLILDDLLARQHAQFLELKFTGTLGVLLKSKQMQYIDKIEPVLDRLEDLRFRLDHNTRKAVLKLAGE